MTQAQLQFLQAQFAARVAVCVQPSDLIAHGIQHDVAVCLSGLDLLSRLSGGNFIHKLARGGVQYDSSVSMEAWEDDTDDKYGWHDPYFEGYRITLYPDVALPLDEHVNHYGVRIQGCIGYLSSQNIGDILATSQVIGLPAPVSEFLAEKLDGRPAGNHAQAHQGGRS